MPEPPPVHVPVEGVGWDIRAVPCERTDMEGRVIAPPEPLEDPRSPSLRVYDHPEVEALRAELAQNNGINGLEIFSPDDDPAEICRVYRRDGFVVVRDCLSVEQLELLRSGCSKALQMIMDVEPDAGRQIMHETGRLPHRYSYGSSAATRQQSAWIEWASLVDLPTTTPILEQIFGGLDNYAVGGMGGEIALPGAMEYQRLHMDGAEPSQMPDGRFEHAASLAETQLDFIAAAGNSPLGAGAGDGPDSLAWQRRAIEMTPGLVTINFLVSDMTTENGPIRQIPGSHTSTQPIPKPADEPPWMRYSTLVGAKAGAAIFRDNRCWHGATPNVSKEIRALPNIEYVPAWKKPVKDESPTMPHEIWSQLTPHGQRICWAITAEPGVKIQGAGLMHPASAHRARLSGNSGFWAERAKQQKKQEEEAQLRLQQEEQAAAAAGAAKL
jgi:hypothetical protein